MRGGRRCARLARQALVTNASWLDELTAYGDHVIGIGDCLAPRTVEEAVFEGLQAACSV